MTDQPRLTAEAIAKIEEAGSKSGLYGKDEDWLVSTPKMVHGHSAEYLRGWHDCYEHIRRVLIRDAALPPR